MQQLSIIIPNYNGAHLLQRCLSSVASSKANLEEVLVVDDAGTDGSVEMLREQFTQVRVIARETNGGFSVAVNEGIRSTSGEFVVLLNSDVEVTPGFLDTIMPLFQDETVFAVSPRILLPSRGGMDEGAKTGAWYHGMFYADQRQGVTEVTPILYTAGSATVYRRSMLEALGGFDEAYSPYYWEDTDLGFRAWKRGWRSLYQPLSTVHHGHSASISRMNVRRTNSIKARNSLFFIWRNIEDEGLLRQHRLWLPAVLLKRAVLCDTASLAGWTSALARRKEAALAKKLDSRHRRLSDREIFETVGVPLDAGTAGDL